MPQSRWASGLLAVVVAVASLRRPALRWVNLALGAWLVLSSWVLPHVSPAAAWNERVVGLLLATCAVIPSADVRRSRAGLQP